MIRVACVQEDVVYNNPEANLAVMEKHIHNLSKDKVNLAIFPEAFLTGYCANSREDVEKIAIESTEQQCLYEDAPEDAFYMSEAIASVYDFAVEHNMGIVVGYAAQDILGSLFNEAVLVVPGENPHVYRKTHLPVMGIDRFVSAGNDISVFDTKLGKIGIGICFDLRHPEVCRSMALQGAELIALPTNWPVGADVSADCIAPTRAAENRVFVATCDRVGAEQDFNFLGKSGIFDVMGNPLARAGVDVEVIVADLDLAQARIKNNVTRPGVQETRLFESRRPDLYDPIVEPL